MLQLLFLNIFIQAEDAVCLSDYCDIMRCEVIKDQEKKQPGNTGKTYTEIKSTDLEVWREPSQRNTALVVSSSSNTDSYPPSAQITGANNFCDK